MASRKISPQAKRRQLEGSRRGSERVGAEFAAVITRRRYCDLVGIHPTTLAKWEKRGVVRPRLDRVMNSPTRVFTEEDVAVGQRLISLLRERRGELSVESAARLARRKG